MKNILVFREGQAGNFFKALLEYPETTNVGFRMPEVCGNSKFNLTLTHQVDYEQHKKHFDVVLRILPTQKIYLSIYNNFMKKLVIEQATLDFQHWTSSPVAWYDICYYNITEYHDMITQDIANNQYENIIDFDRMLDQTYLSQILRRYFDQEITASRQNLIIKYRNLQLQIDLDAKTTSMQQITDNISDEMFQQNPWFFSYCVHKWEKSNGFAEKDRAWSIDQCSALQTRHDLLRISKQYNQIKK